MQEQYYYNPDNQNNNRQYGFSWRQPDVDYLKKRVSQRSQLRRISFIFGCAIILYMVIQTVVSVMLSKLNLSALYSSNAVFSYAVNILFISVLSVALPFGIAALINKKKYKGRIIPLAPLKLSETVLWVGAGMCMASLANIGTSYFVTLLSQFGISLTQGETAAPDSAFACLLDVISIAIIPAICEEFAMRCCALQLFRNYGRGFAVFAVSIVFGLLHGNVIQFIFAFLVGLILAYVTVKTESVIPAMLIHGLNNGLSVVNDVVEYCNGGKESSITVYLFLFWIAAGAICIGILAFKHKLSLPEDKGDCVLTSGEKWAAFLFPGMVVPFLLLILITATTVSIG